MNPLCWVVLALLPLAAATGWWAKNREEGAGLRGRGRRSFSKAYLRTLNSVLNEHPDPALDYFIQNLPVDADTVETHLALGNLFRRRGETERAIRIHQNLIARPNLEQRHRNEAVMELGLDFFQAGVLDRAETIFHQLAQVRETRKQALEYLLDIYQQEREWQDAITVCQQLTAAGGESHNLAISHYYCELAEQSLAARQLGLAQRQLTMASEYAPRAIRPKLLAAGLAVRRSDYRLATRLLRRVLELDANCLSLVGEDLRVCFESLDDHDGYVKLLIDLTRRRPATAVVLEVAGLLAQVGESDRARSLIERELAQGGSLLALDRYFDLLERIGDGIEAVRMPQLREALRAGDGLVPAFVCGGCGFGARKHHWQCPQCGRWEALTPPRPAGGTVVV